MKQANATSRLRSAAILAILGVLFLLAGIFLCVVPFALGTVSQWNGRCHSEVGQIAQHIVPGSTRACGLVALGDASIGWLIGGGIGLIIVAVILRATSRPRLVSG